MVLGLELGFAMAMPLSGFLFLGVWLDWKLGTVPLFIAGCLILGLVTVVVEVKQLILPFLEKRSQKEKKN